MILTSEKTFPRAKAKPGEAGDTLIRRAALTNFNGLLGQVCRIVAGFVVSPLIIRTLGVELYGAWSMITQIQGYFTLSDFRSAGSLKVLLMLKQHKNNADEKRRLVGATAIIWVFSLFILITASLVILPFASSLIRTRPEYATAVKWALALSLVGLAVSQLFSIPGSILRGSNLDYKSMGLRSVFGLAGAFLGLLAVQAGWGIPGLAASGILADCLTGLLWLYLAKRYIDWLGIAKPSRVEMKSFGKTSFWFLLISFGQVLLIASDILLVGFLLGPSAAGAYATTGVLMRFVTVPITTLIASTNGGLVGICGKQEWTRMARVTSQITILSIILGGTVGVVVLALNQAFLAKWVGDGFFVGQPLNVALVLLGLAQCFYRIESMVVDGIIEFRRKALVLLFSGSFSLLTGWILSIYFGSLGIAVAMLLGCLLATGYMSWLIRVKTSISFKDRFAHCARPFLVGGILLAAAYMAMLPVKHWPAILGLGLLVGAAAFGIMITFGLTHADRMLVWNRLRSLTVKA